VHVATRLVLQTGLSYHMDLPVFNTDTHVYDFLFKPSRKSRKRKRTSVSENADIAVSGKINDYFYQKNNHHCYS